MSDGQPDRVPHLDDLRGVQVLAHIAKHQQDTAFPQGVLLEFHAALEWHQWQHDTWNDLDHSHAAATSG